MFRTVPQCGDESHDHVVDPVPVALLMFTIDSPAGKENPMCLSRACSVWSAETVAAQGFPEVR